MKSRMYRFSVLAFAAFSLSAWAGIPAQAEESADKGIGRIRIKIGMEGYDDLGEPLFTADSMEDQYEVELLERVDMKAGEEEAGPGRPEEKAEQEIDEGQKEAPHSDNPPVYEILLSSGENLFFEILEQKDIKITGIESICTKAVRRNSKTELVLTVVIPGALRMVGDVGKASFSAPCRAVWNAAANASGYEILLYRGKERIGFPHRTEGTTYDLSPLMREAGEYRFKIYPLSPSKRKGKAELSEYSKIDEETASANREQYPDQAEGSLPGWREDERGKRYLYSDGMYPQNAKVLIGEKEYCFDQDGFPVEQTEEI